MCSLFIIKSHRQSGKASGIKLSQCMKKRVPYGFLDLSMSHVSNWLQESLVHAYLCVGSGLQP